MAAIEVKTSDQLRRMRRAGLVVAEGLRAMQESAAPGMTTAELDGVARGVLAEAGAASNFLGYGAEYGTPFSGVACISVNEELVHGMPGSRVLAEGDVISVDFGAIIEGWHADAARTFVLGEGRAEDQTLIEVTRGAMWAGVAATRAGGRVNDISRAIEEFVLAQPRRYGTLREYTGHGIGSEMHMAPDVLNYRTSHRGPKIRPGLCLAIEPMLVRGGIETKVLEDDWTVVTVDGSNASQWEHSVCLHSKGLWVLTAEDGGASELEPLGVHPVPIAAS